MTELGAHVLIEPLTKTTWSVALGLMAAGLSGLAAFWYFGFMISVGGPSPVIRRAGARVKDLPHVVELRSYGLRARTRSEARCGGPSQGLGPSTSHDPTVTCTAADGSSRISWSVCPRSGPGALWEETPRTDTCEPGDSEEGIGDSGWYQEPVAVVTIAGFDGFIVSWSPAGRAKRGSGCSFRGFQKDDQDHWEVLHIEASGECNEETLAVMLSTESATAPAP